MERDKTLFLFFFFKYALNGSFAALRVAREDGTRTNSAVSSGVEQRGHLSCLITLLTFRIIAVGNFLSGHLGVLEHCVPAQSPKVHCYAS